MWWITCEHKKVDMWLANRAETAAVAIEFKAIHNNKNFRSKVCEVRYDLSDAKVTPATRAPVVRYAIIVCTFAWYTRGEEGNYVRSSMQPDQFKTAIEDELQSVQAYYVGLPTAHLVAWENICDLENAHYLETSKGCGVWLGLVKH